MLLSIHHAAIICLDYAVSKHFFVFFSDPDGLPLELYETSPAV